MNDSHNNKSMTRKEHTNDHENFTIPVNIVFPHTQSPKNIINVEMFVIDENRS